MDWAGGMDWACPLGLAAFKSCLRASRISNGGECRGLGRWHGLGLTVGPGGFQQWLAAFQAVRNIMDWAGGMDWVCPLSQWAGREKDRQPTAR
jgi:hypothetical protein